MYLLSVTETSLTFTEVNECCHLWVAVNVGIRNTEERTMKNHFLGGVEKWLFLYFDGDLDIGLEIGVKFN